MSAASIFPRLPGSPLDPVSTVELQPPAAAKPWPGSGATKTFSFDPAALLADEELVELSAGTATVDLRLGGEASARPPATDAPPPRYRVLSEVGRGGVGVVLLARDTLLGREVAVKVLLEAHRDRRDVVRRFVDEARITSRMPHHGIVPVHDIGVTPDGRPYFAMSLVHGRSLDRLLHARPGPADDLSRYLTVFHQISQAVAYAHAAGVIHRDLKPGNIMVGDFGTVKVMDWGLAKLIAGAARPEDTGPPSWAADRKWYCSFSRCIAATGSSAILARSVAIFLALPPVNSASLVEASPMYSSVSPVTRPEEIRATRAPRACAS